MKQTFMQLSPEWILLLGITLILIGELVLRKGSSRVLLGIIAILTVIASGLFTFSQGNQSFNLFTSTFVSDPISRAINMLLLAGTLIVLLLSYVEQLDVRGEFYFLLLSALLGGMMLTSSADLITLFVSLELLSLSAYILVGIHRDKLASSEAAWKYVIYGGASSAFILYGMSFLYGLTGTTSLPRMYENLNVAVTNGHIDLLYLAFFLLLVGVSFKIAAVPFHMWAPDVYEGSPITITLFLAVVSKIAGFAFLLRIFGSLFYQEGLISMLQTIVIPSLVVIASLSMIFGNVIALRQSNLKRMLAYSSIGHVGYMLVALITFFTSNNALAYSSLYYYFVAYLLASSGAFAILLVVTRDQSAEQSMLTGLHKRSPWLALSLAVCLLSLAGIPFTAGFMGKFTILVGAVDDVLYWLAGIMLLTTVISYYYYFRVIRQMYWADGEGQAIEGVPWMAGVVIGLMVMGTFLLGVMPSIVLQGLEKWIS